MTKKTQKNRRHRRNWRAKILGTRFGFMALGSNQLWWQTLKVSNGNDKGVVVATSAVELGFSLMQIMIFSPPRRVDMTVPTPELFFSFIF